MADYFRSLGALIGASLRANIWRHIPVETGEQTELVKSLIGIEGIGPAIAESTQDWLQLYSNLRILRNLEARGVQPPPIAERPEGEDSFTGLRFVVTGRLVTLSRREAQAKIKELGGAVSSSVSRKTNYVVVGADPGSKYDSAIRLKIPVLEEDQFLKFLAGEAPEVSGDATPGQGSGTTESQTTPFD
jgi:DNA ligase (NAD+)